MNQHLKNIIDQYKSDKESVYNTWFINNEERLKAFRSIRKKHFGQFLENCLNAKNEEQLINEIIRLNDLKIKGLGPAVASIIYFLHPTIIHPFNTAIINGFNSLFKDKKKLGSWGEYLKIREVIIQTNNEFKQYIKL